MKKRTFNETDFPFSKTGHYDEQNFRALLKFAEYIHSVDCDANKSADVMERLMSLEIALLLSGSKNTTNVN